MPCPPISSWLEVIVQSVVKINISIIPIILIFMSALDQIRPPFEFPVRSITIPLSQLPYNLGRPLAVEPQGWWPIQRACIREGGGSNWSVRCIARRSCRIPRQHDGGAWFPLAPAYTVVPGIRVSRLQSLVTWIHIEPSRSVTRPDSPTSTAGPCVISSVNTVLPSDSA